MNKIKRFIINHKKLTKIIIYVIEAIAITGLVLMFVKSCKTNVLAEETTQTINTYTNTDSIYTRMYNYISLNTAYRNQNFYYDIFDDGSSYNITASNIQQTPLEIKYTISDKNGAYEIAINTAQIPGSANLQLKRIFYRIETINNEKSYIYEDEENIQNDIFYIYPSQTTQSNVILLQLTNILTFKTMFVMIDTYDSLAYGEPIYYNTTGNYQRTSKYDTNALYHYQYREFNNDGDITFGYSAPYINNNDYTMGVSKNYYDTYLNSEIYRVNYNNGYEQGKIDGKDEGYDIGFKEAKKIYDRPIDNNMFRNALIAIAEYPVHFFQSVFNFEIFGINIAAFMFAVITLLVGIFLIKRLLK